MSDALRHWFERRWYGDLRPGALLRLLAGAFGAIAATRRRAYRRGWLRAARLPVPILVVGNLGVGGAGKTPMTIALVEALRARGWRPGVISRGHGGSERGPLRLPEQPDPQRFGDEPALIAARTGAPVAIARERAAAARALLDTAGLDVLIADDGLQHYALARDVEIVMVDARRGFGNRRLLPAGPLREPLARAAQADFRVIAGTAADAVSDAVADALLADAWPMRLSIGDAVPLREGERIALRALAGTRVHAVAGIADPRRFFDALRAHGIEPQEHAFADHHAYRAADFAFDDGAPLLMTEKDAVKCAAFARAHWYAVPLQAILDDSFFDAVDSRLRVAREPHR